MRHKLLAILFLGLLIAAPSVHAQMATVPDPLQYIVAPETPGPNEVVYIEVQGVGSFLGNATVTWQVNGKTVASGVGMTTFSLKVGGVGSATAVHTIINSATNGTMTHDLVFAPSVVHLVWEANTTAPLFYAGKTLYSAGSQLKIVAFPTIAVGRGIATVDKLSFQWFRGDSLVPEASGAGKNVFIFNGDGLQNAEPVSVDVYLGKNKVGHGELLVPVSDPQVLLYDRDPLRGELLDFALPNVFNLNAKEVTLQAEPYFFAQSSLRNKTLSYSWTLNGSETTGPNAADGLLTLRQTSQGAGSASVGVAIQNVEADKFAQAAEQALQILFGQSSGTTITSLFGL